jgi:hypothetical protein
MSEPDFSTADLTGWEERVISDMATGPVTYCFPGFMGSIAESLVTKGVATREPAGYLPAPDVRPALLRQWGWRKEDHPMFRYSLIEPAP